jgi:UrcA family protein
MSNSIAARAAGAQAKFALLLGSLAGVMGAGVACAASPDAGVPTFVVKYSEQSLATDAGVNDLYRRIKYAATKVCPEASIRDLAANRMVQECRDEAVARAIRQIDNSRLAALYASHSKNG